MIQIIPGDRAGADNLAEIIDSVCNTVMAAGPDAKVDRDAIAPEDRVRVYVGRACITGDIAGIVHSGTWWRRKIRQGSATAGSWAGRWGS